MKEIEFTPATSNKFLAQSYIFSNLRIKLTSMQARILVRLVEVAQCEIAGKRIADNMTRWEHSLDHVLLHLPIKSVLPPASKHYEDIHDAVKGLMNNVCEYYDSDKGQWNAAPIISSAHHLKGESYMRLYIADFVWDLILDFSKGFRRYELNKALSLKCPAALRMYMLLSQQSKPISWRVHDLKALFGVADKYPQTTDFVRKVLLPASRELAEKCPVTFEWSYIKQGRAIVGITIKPIDQPILADAELKFRANMAKVHTKVGIPEIYDYLVNAFGFDRSELAANKVLLVNFAEKCPDPVGFLGDLATRVSRRRVRPGKGYIINAIKSETNKEEGNIAAP